MNMFEPCYEHCYLRYGKQYTTECDDKCNYAKAVKEKKELIENAIIFPQTIGDITFYSKDELFEWVENQQKINGINDWKKLGYTDEESQELFEASKIPVTISSDINMEEVERIADEFSRIGCTSFRLTPEEIERILNNDSN